MKKYLLLLACVVVLMGWQYASGNELVTSGTVDINWDSVAIGDTYFMGDIGIGQILKELKDQTLEVNCQYLKSMKFTVHYRSGKEKVFKDICKE